MLNFNHAIIFTWLIWFVWHEVLDEQVTIWISLLFPSELPLSFLDHSNFLEWLRSHGFTFLRTVNQLSFLLKPVIKKLLSLFICHFILLLLGEHGQVLPHLQLLRCLLFWSVGTDLPLLDFLFLRLQFGVEVLVSFAAFWDTCFDHLVNLYF